MSGLLTNLDIAELHEALGNHDQAALYRELHERYDPTEADLAVGELVEEIESLLAQVDETRAHADKHDGTQWRKCAACLAARIMELLP